MELAPLLTRAQRKCVINVTFYAHSLQNAVELAFEAIVTDQRLRDKFHYTYKPLMIKKQKVRKKKKKKKKKKASTVSQP